MYKNIKGYIGAIGDDLPSLIPIFLAITIFFAVFLNTFNVYRNNTDFYSLKNDAIAIANIVKEDPLFIDYNAFKHTCDKVNTKYNWSVFIIPLDFNTDNYSVIGISDITENNFITHWNSEDTEYFFCGNQEIDELKNSLLKKDVIVYRFPVTVQQKFFAQPTWLFVTVWR